MDNHRETGARKLEQREGPDPQDAFSQGAAENRKPAGPYGLTEGEEGAPGTIDQKPRWEGPPENRPRGYLPAVDDPATRRDAAGENLADPVRHDLGDAGKHREPPMSDHARHQRLADHELTPAVLEGAPIYDPTNSKVGTVSHLHGSGRSASVVIDVGGFLGIGSKPVAIPVADLDFMRDEAGEVHAVTSWTKERLKDLPRHEE